MPAPRIFSTLSIRDFRLLWGSSVIHVTGAATELIAQGWMVLLLTNDSALWVGIASGIRGVGHIIFALIGGVLADRLSRRMVLKHVHSHKRAGPVGSGAAGLAR